MKSKITIIYEGDYALETIETTCYVGGGEARGLGVPRKIEFEKRKNQELILPQNAKVSIQIESLESSPLKENLVYENVSLKIDNKKELEKLTDELIKNLQEGLKKLR